MLIILCGDGGDGGGGESCVHDDVSLSHRMIKRDVKHFSVFHCGKLRSVGKHGTTANSDHLFMIPSKVCKQFVNTASVTNTTHQHSNTHRFNVKRHPFTTAPLLP